MEAYIVKVKYETKKALKTDIVFNIASLRASGYEVAIFECVAPDNSVKFRNAASDILRKLKREGLIQLFVFGEDFESKDLTEIEYLKNKYPTLSDSLTDLKSFLNCSGITELEFSS